MNARRSRLGGRNVFKHSLFVPFRNVRKRSSRPFMEHAYRKCSRTTQARTQSRRRTPPPRSGCILPSGTHARLNHGWCELQASDSGSLLEFGTIISSPTLERPAIRVWSLPAGTASSYRVMSITQNHTRRGMSHAS